MPATGTFISIDKFTKFCSRLRTEHYMHMINVMVLLYHRPYYRTSVLFICFSYAIHLQPVYRGKDSCGVYYVKITLISSFVGRSPLTGIWSIWYFLHRMDGIVSTPFLIRDNSLYFSVFIFLCVFALSEDFLRQKNHTGPLNILGLHWSRCGQFSHLFFGNDILHCPVWLT